MGRPLNKKYFGNRNIGTGGYQENGNLANSQNYADDAIGGEGVDSVYFDDSGLTIGAYLERIPSVTFKDPSLPGGVTATGVVTHVEAVKALKHTTGTGYQIDDEITIVGGTGTAARFRVTKLRVISATLGDQANSQNFDGGENLVWDSTVNSHWTTPTILGNVTSTGSPNYDISGWTTFTGGVWDGTDGAHAPTGPITITGGSEPGQTNFTNPTYNTRGGNDVHGGTGDNNGYGGTVTFVYGIEAVELVSGGDYTAVLDHDSATANVPTFGTGTGATLDVYYGVKTVHITEKGSGYINGADALPTFEAKNVGDGSEVQAIGASVTTEDIGTAAGIPQGNTYNQENAIIIRANTTDNGSKIGDIIRQVSTYRYKVKTADGISTCILVPSDTPAKKEGYIVATDGNGNTYFVTKMTAHYAILTRFAPAAGPSYSATGYIDNNQSGGNGEGETLHLVSSDMPGPINLDGATVTWTATPTQGSAQSTVISGPDNGSGEYGYITYYVPGAHVYLGDHNNPVAMTITLPGTGAGWMFENGAKVEWTFSGAPADDQVTIENA